MQDGSATARLGFYGSGSARFLSEGDGRRDVDWDGYWAVSRDGPAHVDLDGYLRTALSDGPAQPIEIFATGCYLQFYIYLPRSTRNDFLP
jgi:hypothetical protein